MICFVRRSTIDYDIRLKKYVDACVETDTPYFAITWDRLKDSTSQYPNECQYKAKAPYGGGLRNILQLVGFIFYLYWNLIVRFEKYKVIHACNLDIFIFVIPFKLLGKKIVFDIYDSVNTKIERLLLPCADTLILPNIKRLAQIGVSESDVKEKLFVVENVPNFSLKKILSHREKFPDEIHIAYVGVFERNIRGIEDALKAVSQNMNLYLDIAGVGDGLEPLVEEYQGKCDRIKYYGKVVYDEAMSIMNNCDYILAIYKPSYQPHIYASPNKYYESLYLGKPIISSKGTIVGDAIEENNTGYVLDENQDISSLFLGKKDMLTFEYEEKSKKCKQLWETTYEGYFEKVLKGKYIHRCHWLAGRS